ncbi:MAG: ribonuclease HII [Deltaproteobacteria bacterium RIFOXYD12_FULL_57_12]|nr:MAG: ribonuclease HII [Deltaproteobacteria bacterium RIFOXYD12_FULL_57_12]
MRHSRVVLPKLWPDPEADSFSFERQLRRQGHAVIAGLDEAGRGPLAGPVVAACVVLPEDCNYREYVDSKQLAPAVRVRLRQELARIRAEVGIGVVTAAEIDAINILQASLLAMKRAVACLRRPPDFLLVDGKFKVPIAIPQQTLIKGESRSASIAAASIVAKVFRDELMASFHQQFPLYNFSVNKGYPTAEHRRALREHGPCAIHRRTFKGVVCGEAAADD